MASFFLSMVGCIRSAKFYETARLTKMKRPVDALSYTAGN
jgi:hypothetical protein